MDVVPLLVLPVVGGYAFAVIWTGSLYNASRESGHRLYFRSVFYAVFLVICAIFTHIIFYQSALYTNILSLIRDALMVKEEPSIWGKESKIVVLFFSFVWGPVFAGLLNLIQLNGLPNLKIFRSSFFSSPWVIWWKTIILRRAIHNNDFELLILRGLVTKSPIMFTLKTGKVYVGRVVRGPNPIEHRRAIRISPVLSGYRSSDTHEFVDTTDYYEAVSELEKPEAKRKKYFQGLEKEDFHVILPSDQICSAHLFNLEVYANHFSSDELIDDKISELPHDVGENTVACSGGYQVLEHPLVYLKIENNKSEECPYCSRQFEVFRRPTN